MPTGYKMPMSSPIHPQAAASAGGEFALQRVLVVDDEPLILLIVAGFLQDSVAECVEAASAEEALRHFQPGAFDLVITDRTMPGMDGLELTREIKKRHPSQRVVLTSGMQSQNALPSPVEGGPDAFLPKPFTRASILDCLAQVLQTG
jgi:CheY-like chemotaxis protein